MKCTAIRKRDGQPCEAWAIKGTTVCRVHGGVAKQVREKGRKRLEQNQVERTVESLSLPVDTDPVTALLEEIRHVAGDVQFLREHIRSLGWDVTQLNRAPGGASQEAPSVWVEMYWQAHDRLVKVCTATLKAGVEERRIQLEEERGQLLADAIRGMLGELGIDITPEVRTVVRRHLSAIA